MDTAHEQQDWADAPEDLQLDLLEDIMQLASHMLKLAEEHQWMSLAVIQESLAGQLHELLDQELAPAILPAIGDSLGIIRQDQEHMFQAPELGQVLSEWQAHWPRFNQLLAAKTGQSTTAPG